MCTYLFIYYYYFLYTIIITIIIFIIIIIVIIIIIIIIITITIIIIITIVTSTTLIFLCYIFYLTYAGKVRSACIIVLYNDGLKAPIRLSGRGRSCLAFARFGMFGLGIAPKRKLSYLFNPVSIQE